MASAHIVFGKFKVQGVLYGTFASQTVASGATSTAANSAYNIATVTANGGPIYAAFSTVTPNAGADPRILVPANATITVNIVAGTKVAIADAV